MLHLKISSHAIILPLNYKTFNTPCSQSSLAAHKTLPGLTIKCPWSIHSSASEPVTQAADGLLQWWMWKGGGGCPPSKHLHATIALRVVGFDTDQGWIQTIRVCRQAWSQPSKLHPFITAAAVSWSQFSRQSSVSIAGPPSLMRILFGKIWCWNTIRLDICLPSNY